MKLYTTIRRLFLAVPRLSDQTIDWLRDVWTASLLFRVNGTEKLQTIRSLKLYKAVRRLNSLYSSTFFTTLRDLERS